jgi:hypothetical protein
MRLRLRLGGAGSREANPVIWMLWKDEEAQVLHLVEP